MILGFVIDGNTNRTGGSPHYRGQTMTSAGAPLATGGSIALVEAWYLCGSDFPTSGSAAITIPNTNTRTITAVAATFIPNNNNALIVQAVKDAIGSATGNSTNPTVSLTTTGRGNAIYSFVGGNIGALTAGQTLITTGISTDRYGAQYALQPQSGSITMGWTATTGRWATYAVAMMEVSRQNLLLMNCG
jgi:hypothetical protein